VELLEELPPTTWGLVAAAVVLGWALSWLWRWYRARRAHKALVAAVIGAGSDYLVDVLVPDGMGGNYHVDFLLLTSLGILVVDLRDVRNGKFPKGLPKWTLMIDSLRSEFPPVERMVSSTVERFGDAWKQLKGAVVPSAMNQQRLF
jgi:hypothetical protein